jgi:hypothetical protein
MLLSSLSFMLQSCDLLLSLQLPCTWLPLLLHMLLPPQLPAHSPVKILAPDRQRLPPKVTKAACKQMYRQACMQADIHAGMQASSLNAHTYICKTTPPCTPTLPKLPIPRTAGGWHCLALCSTRTTQNAASSTARCRLTEAATSRPVHTHKPAAQPGTGSVQRQPYCQHPTLLLTLLVTYVGLTATHRHTPGEPHWLTDDPRLLKGLRRAGICCDTWFLRT